MIPFRLMYRLGFAPWERRDVEQSWQPLLEGPDAPPPGRALDVGCGSGRDAVYLAKRGWQVTAVDFVEAALTSARERAAEEGVEVQWVSGDVAELGRLGLEPGYSLLYDFGCIHGLPDPARRRTARGLSDLAAPGAMLLIGAFKAGRRLMLPRGMDREDVVALLGDDWELEHAHSDVTDNMPRRSAAPSRLSTAWPGAHRRRSWQTPRRVKHCQPRSGASVAHSRQSSSADDRPRRFSD